MHSVFVTFFWYILFLFLQCNVEILFLISNLDAYIEISGGTLMAHLVLLAIEHRVNFIIELVHFTFQITVHMFKTQQVVFL